VPAERSGGWEVAARFGIGPLLLGLDLVAVLIGLAGAELVGREAGEDSPLRKTAAFAVVFLVALAQAGLYRSRLALSVLDDVPSIAGRWMLAAGVAVLGQVVWSSAIWKDYVINWRFLWGAVAMGLLLMLFRGIGYAVVRAMRSRGRVVHRTLIVGAGRVGHQVADILREHPEYGLHPVGFLDADPRYLAGPAGLPVLGTPADLPHELRDGRVHNVVVAFSSMRESEMVRLIRTCDRYRCELFVVPRLFELHHVDDDMDTAWGLPLVRLRRSTYRSPAWRAKRLFDLILAGGAVLLLSPLLALIALAVRLDSGPGVLFRQERVGVDGRTFEVLKFRSMRATSTESATTWNIAKDPRVTRVGRFLRKTRIDELPQIFNILMWQMSWIGPRPEAAVLSRWYTSEIPFYRYRHVVKPGISGWAQVNQGHVAEVDEVHRKLQYDFYYIKYFSPWLDVLIVFRTIRTVLSGFGAR
jgi:exopolysaccharide biosynthesis polyprenyl glycosylphosphotransferase